MANTTIQLKKSATPGSIPSAGSLANGEIALNFADGILYYKTSSGLVDAIVTGRYSFSTINAGGTLLISDSYSDVLDIIAGSNIVITGDAINDRFTISADLTPANNWANNVGSSANSNASRLATAGNSYTSTVGTSGNTYATLVGTSANAFATLVGTSANAYSVALESSGNAYSLALATAGNSYAVSVGVGANNWSNTKLSNTSGVSFAGNLYFPTGYVGIGTTSPGYILDVQANTGGNHYVQVKNFGSLGGRAGIVLDSSGTSDADVVFRNQGIATATIASFPYSQAAPLVFYTNNSTSLVEVARFNNNGFLGIGTQSPATRLTVANGNILLDNNYGIWFKDGSGNNPESAIALTTANNISIATPTGGGSMQFTTRNAGAKFAFYNSSITETFTILSSGNVGIGTTLPTYKLDVNGSANISSPTLIVAGSNVLSTIYTGDISSNAWSNTVGSSANAYSVTLNNAGNSYAVSIGTSGNTYATLVGTSANSYATATYATITTVATNATGANNWSNTVGSSANAYAVALNNAGNSYAVSIGTSSNAYATLVGSSANAVSSTKLANTSDVYFAGNLNIPGKLYITSENSDSLRTRFISGKASTTLSNGALYLNYSYSDPVHVGSGAIAANFYVANGSLGVGTISPTSTLHVIGSANITSPAFFVAGSNVLSTITSSSINAAASANAWANTVGASANSYAVSLEASGNAWTNTVGSSVNSYAVSIGTGGNTYATLVGTSANAYATLIGSSANAYTLILNNSGNAWSNTVGSSANAYAVALNNAGNSYAQSIGTSGNTYASATYSTLTQYGSVFGVTNAAFARANVSVQNNITTVTAVTGNVVASGYISTTDGVYDEMSQLVRITNPGGAAFSNGVGTATGAFKIRIPQAANNNSTMLRATIKIYNYATGTSTTLQVGGYNYNGGGGVPYWINTFVTQETQSGSDLNVRFGRDTTSQCIWIGEVDTNWSYPKVFITEVEAGHSGATASAWRDGWTISQVSSFDTVDLTVIAGKSLDSRNFGSTVYPFVNTSTSSANAYTLILNNSGNAWSNIVASAGNTYATLVGTSANAYATLVGSSANSYATTTYPTKTGAGASGTWGINVTGSAGSAGYATYISTTDTRFINTTPETTSYPGIYANFKQNVTEGLSDGGSYFGEITYRPYGVNTDWSGGPAHQIGMTNNGNIWYRYGSGANTANWSSWRQLAWSDVLTSSFASINSNWTVTNTAYTVANSANGWANTIGAAANTNATNTFLPRVGGTISGDLVITGNVTISGNQTYANTQTLLIGDNLITLNADIPAAVAPSENAGVEVNRGSSTDVSILWNETSDTWTLTENGTTWYDIATNNDISSVNAYIATVASSINAYSVILEASGNAWSNTVGSSANNWSNTKLANTSGVHFNGALNVSGGGQAALWVHDRNATGAAALYRQSNITRIYDSELGADVISFSNTGLVGIGTSNPSVKLDVYGGSLSVRNPGASSIIEVGVGQTSNQYAVIDLVGDTTYTDFGFRIIRYNTGPNAASGLQQRGTGELFLSTSEAAPITFYTTNTERMRITASGNVGIGTTNPTSNLHVIGTANVSSTIYTRDIEAPFYNLYNEGAGAYVSIKGNYLRFGGTSEFMRIANTSGNVGIGTTSPSAKLHVANGYTILADHNTQSAPTTILGGTALSWNYSGGSAEVNFWNLWTSAIGGGFRFSQKTGTSTFNDIYWASNTSHTWYTTGTERMRLDANGNVGIGTTAPGARLEVAALNDATVNYPLIIRNQASTGAGGGSGTGVQFISHSGIDAGKIYAVNDVSGSTSMVFTNFVGEFMRGNGSSVCIGTTATASAKLRVVAGAGLTALSVAGAGNAGLIIDYLGASDNYYDAGAHIFRSTSGTTERMRITSAGNVGVGVSPLDKFHVQTTGRGTDGILLTSSTAGQLKFAANVASGSWNGLVQNNDKVIMFNNGNSDTVCGLSIVPWSNTTSGLRMDHYGNVGIGQASAPERLAVFRDTDNSAEIGRAHVGFVGYNDYAGFSHVDMNGAGNYALLQDSVGGTYLNSASGQPIYFRNNNSDKMIFSSAGNLGIGTTTPAQKLHVYTASGGIANRLQSGSLALDAYTDGSVAVLGASTNHPLYFQTNGAERMRITATGDVGIGTTPSYKFHVAGGYSWFNNNSGDVQVRANVATFSHTVGSNFTPGSDPGDSLRLASFIVKGSTRPVILSMRNVDNNSAFWDMVADGNTNRFYFQRFGASVPVMTFDGSEEVGIATSNPLTRLHVGAKVIDDAGYTYDSNMLMVVHQTATGTSVLNDPKTVMMLARQGSAGQAYGAAAQFNLSRYENAGGSNVGSRTRLDFTLAHDAFVASNNTVMTLQSGGNVGIGTTSPSTKLDVTGQIRSLDGTVDLRMLPLSASSVGILGTLSNHALVFYSNNTERMRIDTSGNVLPGADNTYNLGSISLRWANIFTGDLHLSNEKSNGNDIDKTTGNWTIQEGENDLYIINNKNGKKFKFKLEEIQ